MLIEHNRVSFVCRVSSCALSVCAILSVLHSSSSRAEELALSRRPLKGLCYSPFRANQDPDCGVAPTEKELVEDLEFIKRCGLSRRIRTYGSSGTLQTVPAACLRLGLECWPGAWLSRHAGPTERELTALIEIGRERLTNCPVLIVGNEALLRHDMSEDRLIEALQRVRRDTGLPVAYAEIADVWLRHPRVMESVDVALVHIYPFWSEQPIDNAVAHLVDTWNGVKRRYPDKKLVLGETGWPSAGQSRGRAIPSGENQARYLTELLCACQDQGIDYFYFELFDEPWKKEMGCGGHWGLFTADGKLKSDLAPVVPPTPRGGMRRAAGDLPEPALLRLPAFVYLDGGSPRNHFVPTNYIGDAASLTVDEYCHIKPRSGDSCVRVEFTASRPDTWTGVYWMGPYFNHWGDYPGYRAGVVRKLVFWARGAKGGEAVQFKIGGIRSDGKPFRDSFGPLPVGEAWARLSAKWQQFVIALPRVDTSSLLSGFSLVTNAAANPRGCAFYLDDIVLISDEMPVVPGTRRRPQLILRPGDINAIPRAIREAQRIHVKESWGEQAGECFAEEDYQLFKRERRAEKIAAEVVRLPEVRAAILTLQSTPEQERRRISDTWRKPLRKTWADLGRITREGQTEAGQRAELDIANAIVNLVLKQCIAGARSPTATRLPGWGEVVDPDHDCTVRFEETKLTISVPGTPHDLSAELGLKQANAAGFCRPQAASGAGAEASARGERGLPRRRGDGQVFVLHPVVPFLRSAQGAAAVPKHPDFGFKDCSVSNPRRSLTGGTRPATDSRSTTDTRSDDWSARSGKEASASR